MRVVSFKADDDLIERARRYADEKNITFSEVVRRALRENLDKSSGCKPFITRRIRVYC